MKLEKGDRVRVRRLGSLDEWCICQAKLVSPNGMSVGLRVEDGAIYPKKGGIITGFLPVSLMRDQAVEIATNTNLEMEMIQR